MFCTIALIVDGIATLMVLADWRATHEWVYKGAFSRAMEWSCRALPEEESIGV